MVIISLSYSYFMLVALSLPLRLWYTWADSEWVTAALTVTHSQNLQAYLAEVSCWYSLIIILISIISVVSQPM